MNMKTKFRDQRGAFLVIFALVLLVLLGFTALGIEAGRWYLVRAELSKSVDAAALVAAKNIADPHYDSKKLAEEFGYENFYASYLGSPESGSGAVRFSATPIDSETFQVTGNVDATATLAKVFGISRIPVVAIAAAQEGGLKTKTEIMMVLDRTGSMGNPVTKMSDLKNAATSFVEHFDGTKDKVKMGLISFANDVTLDAPLEDGLAKNKLTNAIKAMNAIGSTNMSEALDRADGPAALNPRKPDDKVEQFVVLFTDGMPTAFRGNFKFYDQTFDAVVGVAGDYIRYKEAVNCRPGAAGYDAPGPWDIYLEFLRPDARYGSEGSNIFIPGGGIPQWQVGDGKEIDKSKCTSFRRGTVRWDLFYTGWPGGPVPGYQADSCIYQNDERQYVIRHMCTLARNLTIAKAQELKDEGIKVYVVGLGTDVDIDLDLLKKISSGDKYLFTTANSSDLPGIFNKIAKQIKLRLVY